jgi:nicotinate-nucleotide pyrophosphorylase (carboxylating)
MIGIMNIEFRQIGWDVDVQSNWQSLLEIAIAEDLGKLGDPTTTALVPRDALGQAAIVARQGGVVSGLPAAAMVLAVLAPRAKWVPEVQDGQCVTPGQRLARIDGPAAGLLMAERLVLNVLGRLSGIASMARRFVDVVAGTRARIYDTRKTTPGWRLLEKYAVRCGGACNHRSGLFEAILIKDNHLAFGAAGGTPEHRYSPAEAVARARQSLAAHGNDPQWRTMIIEVEVDTLAQLREVLPARPDLVLLDNMQPDVLRQAAALRDAGFGSIELEASGGVNLDTVRAIAESGVDRISVGALTHSAVSLDVGLDWSDRPA